MAKDQRICSIQGCGKKQHAKGFCSSHYGRWLRCGDPAGKRVPNGAAVEFLLTVAVPFDGEECLTWPFGTNKGYPWVRYEGVSQFGHRLACILRHGRAPSPNHEAAHSCGQGHKACINPRHLRWATPLENTADKLSHGTLKKGEDCYQSKLSSSEVKEIRALGGTMLQREIGALYGVDQSVISRVLSRKYWAHTP